jgi:hypothetical protein
MPYLTHMSNGKRPALSSPSCLFVIPARAPAVAHYKVVSVATQTCLQLKIPIVHVVYIFSVQNPPPLINVSPKVPLMCVSFPLMKLSQKLSGSYRLLGRGVEIRGLFVKLYRIVRVIIYIFF